MHSMILLTVWLMPWTPTTVAVSRDQVLVKMVDCVLLVTSSLLLLYFWRIQSLAKESINKAR